MPHNNESQPNAVYIEPLTVRISTAVQLTGLSRSRLYELIQSGDLETVKVGRSTLQDVSSKHYDRWHYMVEKRAGMAKWDKFVRALLAKKRGGSALKKAA